MCVCILIKINIYFAFGRSASIVISVYVCVYVCLFVCVFVCLSVRLHISKHTYKFHHILCTCYLWPWLGPPLTAV